MTEVDAAVFRIWTEFLIGAGGRATTPGVKSFVFKKYRPVIAGFHGSPAKVKAAFACARAAGKQASKLAGRRKIGQQHFVKAAEFIKNKNSGKGAGILCK